MSSSDKVYINPEFNSWSKILKENIRLRLEGEEKTIKRKSLELRTIMYSLACYYSRKIGIKVPTDDFTENIAIAITAHQPILDHPGILIKKQLLSKFVSEIERDNEKKNEDENIIGINIIIDTDLSDHFSYKFDDNKKLGRQTLIEKQALKAYIFQVKNYSLTKKDSNFPTKKILALKKENPELDLIQLLTLFRRKFEENSNYLELPFSLLIEQDDFQKFIFEFFLISAETLFNKYNYVLDSFRTEHKIKNNANPFPNLKSEGNTLELPFWIINRDTETREPLYFSQIKDDDSFESVYHNKDKSFKLNLNEFMQINPLPENIFIAPRALLTTCIFRVFLSDFFIHGKGGEKYDKATDAFIIDYLQIEPPKYVVTSRDLMLHKEMARDIFAFQELQKQKREIAFHPNKFIESGIFTDSDLVKLTSLSTEKTDLIAKLKKKKSNKESVASETQTIKEIEKDIFKLVENALSTKFKEVSKLNQNEIDMYTSREFPYFLFSSKDLEI